MPSFLMRQAAPAATGAGYNPVFVGDFGITRSTVRGSWRLSALGLLLFALSLSLGPAAQRMQAAYAAATTPAATPIVQQATLAASNQAAAPTPTPAATTPAATPATHPAVVPACSRGSLAYPAPLNLAALGAGPHASFAGARTYTVYGHTTAQINAQMAACSPVVQNGDGFDASTMYYLNTQYNYGPNASGLCTVTSASVGVNVNMLLPRWANTGASSSVASAWNRFIANLQTHENGHLSLDQSYASKVYNDLMGVPPTACGTIDSTIKGVVARDLAALNAANDNYDAQTGHGATQGASL